MATNPHERANRIRKVLAMVGPVDQLARATGRDSAHVVKWLRGLSEEEWEALATLSGVRMPSTETRELLIEGFARRAKMEAA